MENKKNPPPDKSNMEPEQEPNTSPSTGQHQPDIQDGSPKKKRNSRPQGRENSNSEEFPDNGNPEEYNDGEPIEEKSQRATNSSL